MQQETLMRTGAPGPDYAIGIKYIDLEELNDSARALLEKSDLSRRIAEFFRSGIVGDVFGELSPEAEYLLRQSLLMHLVDKLQKPKRGNQEQFTEGKEELSLFSKAQVKKAEAEFKKGHPIDKRFMANPEGYLDFVIGQLDTFALNAAKGLSSQ